MRAITFLIALLASVAVASDTFFDGYYAANPTPHTVTVVSGGVSVEWVDGPDAVEIWRNGGFVDVAEDQPYIDTGGSAGDLYQIKPIADRGHRHVGSLSPGLTFTTTSSTGFDHITESLSAYPGTVGFGASDYTDDSGAFFAAATGGRGGSTYVVRNLNDSGAGSFRDAVSQPNRMVIFAVCGRILTFSDISFASNITVLGASSCGEGVEIIRAGTTQDFERGLDIRDDNNVIVSHLTIGATDPGIYDPMNVNGSSDIVLVNLTVFGATDETVDIFNSTRVTIDRGLFAEPLGQQYGVILDGDGDDVISYTRNVVTDTNGSGRTPYFQDGDKYVMMNNLTYRRGNWATQIRENRARINIIGNVWIDGPSANNSTIGGDIQFHDNPHEVYFSNNIRNDSSNDLPIRLRNSSGGTATAGVDYTSVSQPFPWPMPAPMLATQLESQLLPIVGHTLPTRGASDQRRVDEITTRTGGLLSSSNHIARPNGTSTQVDNSADGVPDAIVIACGGSAGDDAAAVITQDGWSCLEHWVAAGMPATP